MSNQDVNHRKSKLYNSRQIRSEYIDESFNKTTSKLSVPDFLSSREFEIKSLELAKLKSKHASSTRCFQALPRTLRRRTASHNVKRIPKRLRSKAIREMQNSSNGITLKKTKNRGRNLYSLKMSTKLLKLGSRLKLMKYLPTSMNMNNLKIRQKIKLLQKEIKAIEADSNTQLRPINNTIGSYDITGINKLSSNPKGNLKYSKRQTQFVWLPTHIWHAKRAHLVKKFGYQIPLKPTQKCFKSTSRSSKLGNGGILFDTSYFNSLILNLSSLESVNNALMTVMNKRKVQSMVLNGNKSYDDWIYMDKKVVGQAMVFVFSEQNKILIRMHPSIYEEYFNYLSTFIDASNESIQDCRYALGSIDITGPSSLISLSKIIHPVKNASNSKVLNNWYKLSQFIDNKNFPSGTTFSFNIYDPRLWDKPTNPPSFEKANFNDIIIELNNSDSKKNSIDPTTLDIIMDPSKRNESYRNQPSIKQLSKRRTIPGKAIKVSDSDPQIPIIITKLSASNNWSVILPWFWVLPMWINLTKLSNLQLGGLNQLHQINFENAKPSYPVDYPFLAYGYIEETLKTSELTKKYDKKSSNCKINYEKIGEICNYFGCDWRFLQLLKYGLEIYSKSNTGSKIPSASISKDKDDDVIMEDTDKPLSVFNNLNKEIHTLDDLLQLINQAKLLDEERKARGEVERIPIELYKSKKPIPALIHTIEPFPPLPVIQVSLKLVNKGNPEDGARIYKIPSKDYQTWILKSKKNEECNISTPSAEHLIGFITSGTYNLNEGSGTGIGCIDAHYGRDQENGKKHVLLRNIGCSVSRLAQWQEIC